MNIREFRDYFKITLKKLYPASEIDTFLFLLLEEYLNFKRIDIVLKSLKIILMILIIGAVVGLIGFGYIAYTS